MAGLFIVTAFLVAVAELGDKTQMLSLLLATRYPARRVFVGVLLAVLLLQAIATGAGRLVGDLVPAGVLAAVTSALFIVFGVWTYVDAAKPEGEESAHESRRALGPVLTVAVAFFLAELGDKTQVLTFAVAADPGVATRALSAVGFAGGEPTGPGLFVAVWLGSVLGMMVVNGAAILVGAAVGRRLPRRVVGRVSGVAFILFGIVSALAYLLGR